MEKKKVLCIFFFLFFFGDVIIHKTGTMLATGQGPGATPSGPKALRMGTVCGIRESLRVRNRAGGDGGGTTNWGSNSNTCQEGAPGAPQK